MADYDLDIILVAHFAERTRGGSPPGVGQFAQELFETYNHLIEARIAGLDSRQRSVIAGLAFFATGLTPAQNADLAVAEFVTVNS